MSSTVYSSASSDFFCKRIRAERLKQGKTQEEFAKLLGISVSYLGALERGSRPASRNILNRFHEQFGLSYEYLLEQDIPSHFQHTVHESDSYKVRRDLSLLLGNCSAKEVSGCYHLIRSYLDYLREQTQTAPFQAGSAESSYTQTASFTQPDK